MDGLMPLPIHPRERRRREDAVLRLKAALDAELRAVRLRQQGELTALVAAHHDERTAIVARHWAGIEAAVRRATAGEGSDE